MKTCKHCRRKIVLHKDATPHEIKGYEQRRYCFNSDCKKLFVLATKTLVRPRGERFFRVDAFLYVLLLEAGRAINLGEDKSEFFDKVNRHFKNRLNENYNSKLKLVAKSIYMNRDKSYTRNIGAILDGYKEQVERYVEKELIG